MFLQIFDLIVSDQMKLPFKGALYAEISIIFDAVRVYPLIASFESEAAYWGFVYASLASIIAYYLGLVGMEYLIRKKKVVPPILCSYLKYSSLLYLWVLLIPITDFLISIFQCDSKGKTFLYDSNLECFGGTHAMYCVFLTLGLILFYLIIILISSLFTESRPFYTDCMRLHDNNEEIYLSVYRIILTIVAHFTTDDNYQWLSLCIHLFASIHMFKNYYRFLPFYEEKVSILYGSGCLAYIWIAVNALILKALEGKEYSGQIIVLCFGLLFAYPTTLYLRRNKVEKILMHQSAEKIRNDLELDQFVVNFQKFLARAELKPDEEMMLVGFLFMHREECTSILCPLKQNDSLYLPLADQSSDRQIFPSKDRILHQHLINSVYHDYSRSRPHILTAVMHISYAYFLFFQMGNIHSALLELNLAEKLSNSFQQSFTIFKLRQLIEEHLVGRFKNAKGSGLANVDMTIVIIFENLYSRFEKAIQQSANDHIEFWIHLDSNLIDLNMINKLGMTIIANSKQVADIWASLQSINPQYPNGLYLYGNYLSQIKNDFEQGDELKNSYLQAKRLKSLEDYENGTFDVMFAEDTTVIVMGGNQQMLGKIIKTNQGIYKLFGYNTFEVSLNDVCLLMPRVIAAKHAYFLDKYIATGKERILNGQLETFAMYRSGAIFPISLVVKPVPSLKNDIQYIGMIRRINKEFEYILTDETGIIDSISDGIMALLKLPIQFFKEHEIPIQVLVPELCEVSRTRGHMKEQQTNFEAWNGLRDLRFFIPKNLSTTSNRGGNMVTSSAKTPADEDNGSGATGTGTGTGTQTSSSSKAKTLNLLGVPGAGSQNFTGLRNPESLKSISNMFKNAEHKGQPDKYKTNLLNHVNYSNPEFEKVLKTHMQTTVYSDSILKIKVFKIFVSKKKGGRGGAFRKNGLETESSDGGGHANVTGRDEDTLMHKHGLSGMSTLNDNLAFQKYKDIIQNAKSLEKNFNYKKLQHDIDVLKVLLERQKKVRSHGNIMTPAEYEQEELQRMLHNIQVLEGQISEMHSESSKNSQPQKKQIDFSAITRGPNKRFSSKRNLLKFSGGGKEQQEEDKSPNGGTGGGTNGAGTGDSHSFQAKNNQISTSTLFQGANLGSSSKVNNEEVKEGDSQAHFGGQDAENLLGRDLAGGESEEAGKWSTPLLGPQAVKDLMAMQDLMGRHREVEDGRKQFVTEFFKQNMYGHSIPESPTKRFQMASENLGKQDSMKRAYHVDLQNNLMKKLHSNARLDRQRTKEDYSSKQDMNSSSSAMKKEATDAKQEELDETARTENNSLKIVEDTGSVTSDTKTLIRHLRVLRNAVYENYSPQSIQNLRYSAMFVNVVLVTMAITSFLVSKQKYDRLTNNFHMIHSSEERMQSITSINANAMTCALINQGMLTVTDSEFFQQTLDDIYYYSKTLHEAQVNLTNSNKAFNDEFQQIINPTQVVLSYNTSTEALSSQTLNIWSAVMQLTSAGLVLKSYPLAAYSSATSYYLWFVFKNAMNSILEAVSNSTQGILDDTAALSTENTLFLRHLLLVASCCLLASLLIIMPVVTKVHKDKDKLLSLFLQIDQSDVKSQLVQCKEFFSAMQPDEKHSQATEQDMEFAGGEAGEEKKDDATDRKKDPSSDEMKKFQEEKKKEMMQKKFQRKGKKHRKYSTNYIKLILKFLIVISFLEGYFLFQYFRSDIFLEDSQSMIREAASIADRRFSNYLLFQVFFQILGTNGTTSVLGQNSVAYLQGYIDSFYLELEKFLAVHSNNTDIHDQEFNDFFTNLVYQDVCSVLLSGNETSECEEFQGGILSKGLYSANLAFWDNIRELMNEYQQSNKSAALLKSLLNSERLKESEELNLVYFQKAYTELMDALNSSIEVQFSSRNTELTALFAAYLVLLALLYFILWGKFVESMRHSLWVTKQMLSIIPLEVIEKVKAIKFFLMTISRSALSASQE